MNEQKIFHEVQRIMLVGYSEETNVAKLNDVLKKHSLLAVWPCTYEDAAYLIINSIVINEFVALVIVGTYTPSKDQIGEADESALEICRQNSQKLVELCQQRHLSHVLVDTEKSPNWPDNLKKLLA